MQKLLFVILLLCLVGRSYAVCDTVISRTNASANSVLTSTKYNTDLNTVYTRVNNLPGDCIQDATIAKAKLETGYKDTAITTQTGTYTVQDADELVLANANGGAFTVNLPTAVGITGRRYEIKKTDTTKNLVTIDPASTQTIDGLTTMTLNVQNDSVIIVSDGSNWQAIGGSVFRAKIAANAYIAGTLNCTAWTRNSATLGQFSTDADCPGPTIVLNGVGDWQTTDSDLPRFSVNNLPQGKYLVRMVSHVRQGAGSIASLAISDGTTTCYGSPQHNSSIDYAFTVECTFTYTTSANRFFELYGANVGAAGNTAIQNNITSPASGLQVTVEYMGPY